jgi:hypothetical protein
MPSACSAKTAAKKFTARQDRGDGGEHAMEAIEDAVLAVYAEMGAAGKLDAKPEQQQKAA